MSRGNDGMHDFDFLFGRWTVAHRRLKRRLAADPAWEEFAGTATCESVLDGMGNLDQIVMPTKGYSGATLRLFNPVTREWSLYWAESRTGVLFPPVVGRFAGGRGEFYGADVEGEQPVKVRFVWSHISATSARWEQAFSVDDGRSWEANWQMHFTRMAS